VARAEARKDWHHEYGNYKRQKTGNEQTLASKAFGKRGFCRGAAAANAPLTATMNERP
jgi:hypothetical protein